MGNLVLTIIYGTVLILLVVTLGGFVVLGFGFPTLISNSINWLKSQIRLPKRKRMSIQTSILDYCPRETTEESEGSTNPDADSDTSEEQGYENSSVLDSEDSGEE